MFRWKNLKAKLKELFPFIKKIYRLKRKITSFDTEKVFTDIYKRNIWGSNESVSGAGSELEVVHELIINLPKIITKLNIETFLDIPCGDFNWMNHTNLDIKKYIGGDIVQEIVDTNNKKYASSKISFQKLNIISDKLPDSDLLFCRDCLVHFSYADIKKAILNIKKNKITYLMVTTFPGRQNSDIITGEWRPIDLMEHPFNFPEPLILVNENCQTNGGQYSDKSMAVWKVNDIQL